MVQRVIAGRPLAELAATLSPAHVRACLRQAGAALAALHSVAVDGFYQRHHEVWDFSSWEEVAASNLRDRTAERATVVSMGITDAEFATLISTLDALRSAACRGTSRCCSTATSRRSICSSTTP